MIILPSHAAVRLGQYLFPLFALALDLPEDFFSDKVGRRNSYIVLIVRLTDTVPGQITKPAAIMRLLYYPPQTGVIDDRTIGIGAHTEYVNKRNRKTNACIG